MGKRMMNYLLLAEASLPLMKQACLSMDDEHCTYLLTWQVAEGARLQGAGRIIGVDLNPDKFEIGKGLLLLLLRRAPNESI
ncbi:hypothetical protein BHM03_00042098 [Ensete ventricosum]|nr:hypothetical protein BHM03_00042098 [Ensete ventricosum]